MAPRLFASVEYYATLAQYRQVHIDTAARYDKRAKAVHRFDITSTQGPLALTVPVSRPSGAFLEGNLRWNQVTVSDHGRWWETIPGALESAYGRTPFFEFYIDSLLPLFTSESRPITDMVLDADAVVRRILGLETEIIPTASEGADDLRRTVFVPSQTPYWQIRSHLHGFKSGLSILDLLFNLGPDAPLHLLKLAK